MKPIVARVEGVVGADVATTYAIFARIELPTILRGYGPLPAVVSVANQVGDWDRVGQTREIVLGDGSRMREELTLVDAPSHFAYVVDGFTGPLRHLVREMRGAWWFDANDDGTTHARWRYEFELTSGFARPLATAIVRWLWTPNMRRALALATARAERAERAAR